MQEMRPSQELVVLGSKYESYVRYVRTSLYNRLVLIAMKDH